MAGRQDKQFVMESVILVLKLADDAVFFADFVNRNIGVKQTTDTTIRYINKCMLSPLLVRELGGLQVQALAEQAPEVSQSHPEGIYFPVHQVRLLEIITQEEQDYVIETVKDFLSTL